MEPLRLQERLHQRHDPYHPFPSSFNELELNLSDQEHHPHHQNSYLDPIQSQHFSTTGHPFHQSYPSGYQHHLEDPYASSDLYHSQMAHLSSRHLPLFSDPYAIQGHSSSRSGMSVGSSSGLGMGYGHPTRGMGAYGSRGGMMAGRELGMGMGHGRTSFHPSMPDPFIDGIDHDYGYGRVGALSGDGLSSEAFRASVGPMLDDLYLYELMLRSDQALNEQERLRRWEERLRWEELNEIERENRWRAMSLVQRTYLGIGHGSYWAHQLGGLPLHSSLGDERDGGLGLGMRRINHSGPPHDGLSMGMMNRDPMWWMAGLGMGRRLSNWRPARPLKPKHLLRQAQLRADYAERRGEIPPRPLILGPGLMGTG